MIDCGLLVARAVDKNLKGVPQKRLCNHTGRAKMMNLFGELYHFSSHCQLDILSASGLEQQGPKECILTSFTEFCLHFVTSGTHLDSHWLISHSGEQFQLLWIHEAQVQPNIQAFCLKNPVEVLLSQLIGMCTALLKPLLLAIHCVAIGMLTPSIQYLI